MKFAAAVVSALVLSLAGIWFVGWGPGRDVDDVGRYRTPTSSRGEPVLVSIPPGSSPGEIAEQLETSGAIESSAQFRVLTALLGYEASLQAGEYEFQPRTAALDALYRIRQGLTSTTSVTVVEGWRLEEIADAVAEQGFDRDDFLAAAVRAQYDFPFLQDLGIGQRLDGYLFPATYSLLKRDTAEDIVEKMLQTFADNVPPSVQEAAAQQGLTLREALTLASIIEREAQVADERPIMAQVFLRRLELGMTLDADPTVQYALAQQPDNVQQFGYWKQGLTEEDLQVPSPYNTYQEPGLPPGPICSPGLDAINAVLNPAGTSFLFFVARPDGSHIFAETFEEHLENIEQAGQ